MGLQLPKRRASLCLFWCLAAILLAQSAAVWAQIQNKSCTMPYQFGAGQSDITGPIAESGLNGYGDFNHKAEGLHQRLRARAFVFEDPCEKNRIALVINDIAMIHHNIRREVLLRLDQELPGVFTEKNLMLSATHTHAGHGGYGHFFLYNITTLGFNEQAYEAIVAGTVEAIVKANRQLQPAELRLSQALIEEDIAWNRSLEAYELNPISERNAYSSAVDNEMTVLTAYDLSGKMIASLNWHAVHPVSLPMDNKLVSGDNKGLAAYFVEQHMGSTYRQDDEFVAGFFQANSGDISPYDFTIPFVDAQDYWDRMEYSAKVQARQVQELMREGGDLLSVALTSRHRFVDLHGFAVEPEFSGQAASKTCHAALGVAFAAGTENGQPLDWFKEGTVYGVNWPAVTLLPEEQACHAEKVLLLPTGKVGGWTAHILPYQLFTIGELAIIAAPFEATSMVGRRLKAMILEVLKERGVHTVVFTGLANEYSHYVTTPEEYRAQNYEGGSTLFGPLSYAAHSQIFYSLAKAILGSYEVDPGPQPPSLDHQKFVLQTGVVLDASPIGKAFGAVEKEPLPRYRIGERVEVVFWGAHPKNDLKRGSSYLTVEQETAHGWQALLYDWDHQTRLMWQRDGLARSKITIHWQLNESTTEGRYRICHSGKSKSLFGKLNDYHGCSKSFVVVASH